MDTKEIIYNWLAQKKSIFLVGPADSGKSWFVVNELMPFLRTHEYSVSYFHDCDELPDESINVDCLIIDEVETWQDKEILEKLHSEETPYYSGEYMGKVLKWFQKLIHHKQPCVYIITRNDHQAIEYLLNNTNKTDWDRRAIVVINFKQKL